MAQESLGFWGLDVDQVGACDSWDPGLFYWVLVGMREYIT